MKIWDLLTRQWANLGGEGQTPQRRRLLFMNLRETFAANLRHYRQEKGVSQEDLAHRAGLDRTHISSLERSVYSASIDVIQKVAVVLDVEPHKFLEVRKHR